MSEYLLPSVRGSDGTIGRLFSSLILILLRSFSDALVSIMRDRMQHNLVMDKLERR